MNPADHYITQLNEQVAGHRRRLFALPKTFPDSSKWDIQFFRALATRSLEMLNGPQRSWHDPLSSEECW
jgi:hypothetical protein